MLTLPSLFKRKPKSPTRYPAETLIHINNITGKHNQRYKVRSRSNKKAHYTVNTQEMTCDCSAFKEFRNHYPKGDVRRICYHQYYQMCKLGLEKEFEPMIRLILRYGRGEHHFFTAQKDNLEIAFGFQIHSPHLKVIAIFDNAHPTIGTYNLARHIWEEDKHGYNPDLRNKHEDQILDLLTNHFRLW